MFDCMVGLTLRFALVLSVAFFVCVVLFLFLFFVCFFCFVLFLFFFFNIFCV